MQFALRRTGSSIDKFADGHSTTLRKSLGQSCKLYSKNPELSTVIIRNSDQRCFLFTLVALEFDARQKLFAPFLLPLQISDEKNCSESETDVNMDGQNVVSSPVSPLPADQQEPHKVTSGRLSVNTGLSCHDQQTRRKGQLNKRYKAGQLHKRYKAAKDPSVSRDESYSISNGSLSDSVGVNSDCSGRDKESSDLVKPVTKGSGKKGKRKAKQNRKHSSGLGSFDSTAHQKASPSADSSRGCICRTMAVETTEQTFPGEKMSDNISSNMVNSSPMPMSCISRKKEDEVEGRPLGPQHMAEDPAHNQNNEELPSLANTAINISKSTDLLSKFEVNVASTCMEHPIGTSWISSENDTLETPNSCNDNESIECCISVGNSKCRKQETLHGTTLDHISTLDCICCNSLNKSSPENQHFSHGSTCDSAKDALEIESNHGSRYQIDGGASDDRITLYGHECSGSDIQMTMPSKRSKQSNMWKGSCQSTSNFLSVHNQSGKENTHSIWQKVQKNAKDQATYEPKRVGPIHVKDANLASSSETECMQYPDDSHQPHMKLDDDQLKAKSLKAKRQPVSCPKQINDPSQWRASNIKENSIKSVNPSMHEGTLKSETRNDGLRDNSTSTIVSDASVSTNFPVCVENRTGAESASSTVLDTGAGAGQNFISGDKVYWVEVKTNDNSHLHATLSGDSRTSGCNEGETGILCQKYGKQDRSIGSVLQKWVPVARKDAGPVKQMTCDSSNSKLVELSPANMNSPVLADDRSVLTGNNLPPDFEPDAEMPMGLREKSPTFASARSLQNDIRIQQAAPETDISKIYQAANDAYLLQIQSEEIGNALGGPLAEFEKFLYSAAPELVCVSDVEQNHHCCKLQIDRPLCRHQIPGITLGSIWQWYEQLGSYGLEVKADDFINSRRSGARYSEFHAYFVPFLSAVQIFRHSQTRIYNDGNASVSNNLMQYNTATDFSNILHKTQKEGNGMESSSIGLLPLPKSDTQVDESELAFEYFEFEQPQQRLPLFDKVKELINNSTSNCHVFGDPRLLECLDLRDVHPSSWYSVAWYPIYRIPEGNFRAAFLTYHSFGHYIQRGSSSPCSDKATSTIWPVIGLESYNAQNECWFKSRIPSSAPTYGEASKILKERVMTLERSASTLARACIIRGSQKSTNFQSDYEFFLSRHR